MKNKNSGFTLIELMVVVSILAILLAVAVPSFSGMVQRGRLKAVAEEHIGHLYMAKAEALKTGQPIYYSVKSGAGQCYGFKKAAACDCAETSGATLCDLLRIPVDPNTGVTMSSSYAASDIAGFEPVRGSALLPGIVTWTNAQGSVLKTGVSVLGRVFTCSPAGAGNVAGYGSTGC